MTGALIFSTLFSFAQTEKGNFFLIGSSTLDADLGKIKTKANSITSDNYKYHDLDLNTAVGYTVINNLPIGIYVSVDFYKNTYLGNNTGYDKGTSFAIGPFARYYFANLNGFMPMVEAAIGYGIDNNKADYGNGVTKDNRNMWEYWVAPGFTYFFNKHIGIDGEIGYYHQTINYKDQGDKASSGNDRSDFDNDLFLYFGVVVRLGK